MSEINGTIQDGQVILETPADLPNGTPVTLEVRREPPFTMMTDDEQGDDPESIARWLAAFDSLEPPRTTPEELAEWEKMRAEDKAWELANWDKRCRQLESLFDDVTPHIVVANPEGTASA